jgi:hypothetical protein
MVCGLRIERRREFGNVLAGLLLEPLSQDAAMAELSARLEAQEHQPASNVSGGDFSKATFEDLDADPVEASLIPLAELVVVGELAETPGRADSRFLDESEDSRGSAFGVVAILPSRDLFGLVDTFSRAEGILAIDVTLFEPPSRGVGDRRSYHRDAKPDKQWHPPRSASVVDDHDPLHGQHA